MMAVTRFRRRALPTSPTCPRRSSNVIERNAVAGFSRSFKGSDDTKNVLEFSQLTQSKCKRDMVYPIKMANGSDVTSLGIYALLREISTFIFITAYVTQWHADIDRPENKKTSCQSEISPGTIMFSRKKKKKVTTEHYSVAGLN